MSIDDVNADMLGHVHQTIEKLGTLWDQVSMDQEMRVKRTESAYALFYNTMNEIVANEEQMVKGVFEDIKTELSDIATTREELGLGPFPIAKYKPNSIALLKALSKDKKALVEKRLQIQREAELAARRQDIIFQYTECYAEILALAEKCYADNLLSRFPEALDFDIHEETLLNEIRHELENLRNRYESGKQMFDKFSVWYECFKQQDQIEALLNTDKARKNRGGCLTDILREQKKNNTNCARYLKELKTACEEANDDNVTIEGFPLHEFAEHLVQQRQQQKETEKEVKKLVKAKQLQMESRFGASGSPAAKSGSKSPSSRSLKSPKSVLKSPSVRSLKTPTTFVVHF